MISWSVLTRWDVIVLWFENVVHATVAVDETVFCCTSLYFKYQVLQ